MRRRAMEYTILTQGNGNYRVAADNLMVDVILHQQGDWHPSGGVACCLVDDRFIVMQAMTREVQEDADDD